MILADENIHSGTILTLRAEGLNVISICEDFKSSKDEEVIHLALKDDIMVLTEDNDFGE